MPKPKTFLKEAKTKKKAAQRAPETADEYLALGVEQEEAGEKWRAGDAAKSLRFFMRAINTYDEGLSKHPSAFDLAYNKARVQYEITQHPRLKAQLSAPLSDVLQEALESHRVALALEQDNADALFNTGQVLTSIAEILTDSKHPSDECLSQAVKLLQEAIELFQRCLLLQELKYTEMQEQIKQMELGDAAHPEVEMQNTQKDAEQSTEANSADEQEQWAAIVEPVTKDTLVDTAIAQLETLTTLCNLLTFNPGVGLGWVEDYSSDLLQKRISTYVEGSNRQYEAALARAKFTCGLNELLYRSGQIEAETYSNEVSQAFGTGLDLSADPGGLCSKADALSSFNTALMDLPPYEPEAFAKALSLRWQALSAALDALTKASKHPEADDLPKIHLARGDVEIARWRLGMPPWNHAMAQQYAATLLRNAQTYYRGAAALARRDGAAEELRDGSCKEAIAAALEGQKEKLDQLRRAAPKELMMVAEDVVDDGWMSPGDMEGLLS
ncbi:uncharacterized protein BO97DRAFT_378757 [Aspergillus homomorphus CBS 101889]|uniref:TPR-like protein n=1 Tax=Aspergillus homomorphus (strain CBS 101889) TaxID=1450537 RepID=A0A395HII3_ASPHC|nr:hypothetical protein BO97DRAFT_378757 [Aspergillus homomorphus CBS 101889]RAL07299.1 hypothetical protein BO97DRAFT_378757 [Aspergillus homomorphus CBS 101889]